MTRTDDLVEIAQVASLYGHLIDQKKFAKMSEVFADDAIYESAIRGTFRGLPAIVDYLSSHSMPLTHNTTNFYIERFSECGDHAYGLAKFLALLPDLTVAAGDYNDEWIRTPNGWRLLHRKSSFRMGLHSVDERHERTVRRHAP